MKSNAVLCGLASSVLITTAAGAGGKEPIAAGDDGPSRDSKATNALVIDGERFSVRVIRDSKQDGLAVCAFWAPEKWRDKSQVAWNYANIANPAAYSSSAENPANGEAYFGYSPLEFFSLRPDSNLYRPGQRYGGPFFAHQPQPAAGTLLAFIQQAPGANAKRSHLRSEPA